MDVSDIISSQSSQQNGTEVEREIPLEIDAGLLLVTDLNPIDPELYKVDTESYLHQNARDGVQSLLNTLFSLPVSSSEDGPLASLPKPTTLLPRAKPLPQPKPQTKWEQFAAAKGINKTKKDKKMWDEERQEWVDRWGKGGKNREKEEQWIHEVPDDAPNDYNPATAAKAERKQRIAKNEAQQKANLARAERTARKSTLEKSLLQSKTSTASMGKFDKKLEGEPKVRGVKRKFAPNEQSISDEKRTSLAVLSRLDSQSSSSHSKKRREPAPSDDPRGGDGGEGVLNVRKAIRFASRGRGSAALAGGRGRGGARRGGMGRKGK
ncbi:RRS1-domain-containing protein [Clavulina sp. PMI_390]|nr:RRS1-domain-containing protein [Clavulina sp. PMI_390]